MSTTLRILSAVLAASLASALPGCGAAGDACEQYCQALADCEEDDAEAQDTLDQCHQSYDTLRSSAGANPATSEMWQDALDDCEEYLAETDCDEGR